MILENLRLENFKNYKSCYSEFNPGLNFIYGNNGNGKTNLLESVSMMCYTKSFLQNSEQDCVKYGENRFDISGGFVSNSMIRSKIHFSYDSEQQSKKILLNKEPVGRVSSFFGKYPLVVLSPQDIKLSTGTPGDRRRNFDLLISQANRVYVNELKDLNRILKQKNALLKENLSFKKYSPAELKNMITIWNEELAETGTKIIIRRVKFVSEFRKYIEDKFKDIVKDSYIPVLEYKCELVNEEDSYDEQAILKRFSGSLEEKYSHELQRGISLVGPQRDNYIFRMNKSGEIFDIRIFASQGEHKTFLVALKLSEYMYLKDRLDEGKTGEPILLLDDLFSELDKNRIAMICKALPHYNQVFITTTDIDYLQPLKEHFAQNDISVFNIINGTASLIN